MKFASNHSTPNRPEDLPIEKRIEVLHGVPTFSQLDEHDLRALANACEVKLWNESDEIARFGDSSKGLHIIVDGRARRLVYSEAGTLSEGEAIGINETLKANPFAETIEVYGGPMTTLSLSTAGLKQTGLHHKIGAMQRKKGLKRRDVTTVTGFPRRTSGTAQEMPANDDDIALIAEAIGSNQNISEVLQLTPEQIEFCAREAYKRCYAAGETVFEKGDYGYRFFVVIDGVFEVINTKAHDMVDSGDSGTIKLKHGDSFGELALLYNAPRTATVACKRMGSVWVITRQTFRNLKQVQLQGQLVEYSELLRTVDVFEQRGAQLSTICNSVEKRTYQFGDVVVRQGAPADCFYLVFQGECASMTNGEEDGRLDKGAYFGENFLLEPGKWPTTIEVVSDTCTLLTLDRVSFNALLVTDEEGAKVPPLAIMQGIAGGPVNRDDLEHVGVLGAGAFGLVTLERHIPSGKLYALKAMSKKRIVRDGLKTAVVNEKLCLQLLDSDFIVRLIGTFRDQHYVYLLLEACFGGELFDVFHLQPELCGSEVHARFYAACAALGLEHMHSRRLIYRDLKLENCLLTLNGYLKLTDLGISKVSVGKTHTVCGTADYLAPEMLRQTGHNRAVDWWALGVLIYMMMTGRTPFDAPDAMKIYRKIIKGFGKVQFPDDFPEPCAAIIHALCRRTPEERLCMITGGVQNFKDHPWYRLFSWPTLEAFEMQAPFLPGKSEEQVIEKAQRKALEPLPEELGCEDGGDDVEEFEGEEQQWHDVFDMSSH